MKLRLFSLVVIAAAIPALAHHSFSAEYDKDQPVSLKGTLTKIEWTNPHGWVYLDVKGDDGKSTNWAVEFGAPNTLLRRGLRKSDFPTGVELLVKGYRAKSGSPTQRDQRYLPGRAESVHRFVQSECARSRTVTGRQWWGRRFRLPGVEGKLKHAPPLAALSFVLWAAVASAQTPAAGTSIPRGADGKPDFSGIWQSLSGADYGLEPHLATKDGPPGAGVVEGNVIPYQPSALQQRARNFAARATADPRTKCFTLGTPRGIYNNEPFQIFQRPRDLTLLFEFGHPVRTIHTNATEHPDGHIDFWLGDSRGHWDGDTLVVDVTDFNGETWLDRAGNFNSDDLHLVERWTFVDRNTIRYRATFDDPKVYTKPWTIEVLLYRRLEPNVQNIENYCATLDYDEYYPFPGTNDRGDYEK